MQLRTLAAREGVETSHKQCFETVWSFVNIPQGISDWPPPTSSNRALVRIACAVYYHSVATQFGSENLKINQFSLS
jgi:hypothetical protein